MIYRDVLHDWWTIKMLTLSRSTCLQRERMMRKYINPTFGDMDINDITVIDIAIFLQGLRKIKLDVHGERAIFNESFDYAIEHGYVQYNPMREISIPHVRRNAVQIFTLEEIEKLIANAHPKWFADAIEIGYLTGMRRGEVLGLKWEDINFEEKRLSVCRSLAGISGREIYIRPPKSESSKRIIWLDNRALSVLQRLKSKSKSDWVFTRVNGDVQPPTNVPKYMHISCDYAKIPARSFHTLRHTHASILLMQGVHPKIVQERLGHCNVNLTISTYGHYFPCMQGQVVDVLNRLYDDK